MGDSRTMDVEWMKSRLHKLGKTHEDLAQALDRDRSVATKILSGKREIKVRELPALARVFEISESEMAQRAGLPLHSPAAGGGTAIDALPLFYKVEAGRFTSSAELPAARRERVPLRKGVTYPDVPVDNCVAAYIVDDSCDLACPPGTYLICVPLDVDTEPLRFGDKVICARQSNGRFETRCALLTATPTGDLLLTTQTRDRARRDVFVVKRDPPATVVADFTRPMSPEGDLAVIPYVPQDDDDVEILARIIDEMPLFDDPLREKIHRYNIKSAERIRHTAERLRNVAEDTVISPDDRRAMLELAEELDTLFEDDHN